MLCCRQDRALLPWLTRNRHKRDHTHVLVPNREGSLSQLVTRLEFVFFVSSQFQNSVLSTVAPQRLGLRILEDPEIGVTEDA